MSGELEGQVAVITGAGHGIGLAITTAMAEAGARVALGGRDEDALRSAWRELSDAGHEAMWGRCDVCDPRSLSEFATRVLARFERINAVVANAGIAGPTGMIHEIEPAQWQACIDTDLTGVFLTFR